MLIFVACREFCKVFNVSAISLRQKKEKASSNMIEDSRIQHSPKIEQNGSQSFEVSPFELVASRVTLRLRLLGAEVAFARTLKVEDDCKGLGSGLDAATVVWVFVASSSLRPPP